MQHELTKIESHTDGYKARNDADLDETRDRYGAIQQELDRKKTQQASNLHTDGYCSKCQQHNGPRRTTGRGPACPTPAVQQKRKCDVYCRPRVQGDVQSTKGMDISPNGSASMLGRVRPIQKGT